jgi:hypothetical protein
MAAAGVPMRSCRVDGAPRLTLAGSRWSADRLPWARAAAFDARVDGRPLSFERRGGGFADRETGSRWDIAGRAVGGELAGERLEQIRHDQQFWFALAAFVPEARIER